MKQILSNVLSVLACSPGRYRPPRHPALAAGLCGGATTILALALFGPVALWVLGMAYLVALVAFPCKIVATQDVVVGEDDTGPAFARALFAASIATWPLGTALAAGLPAELIAVLAVHGAVQVWVQVELPHSADLVAVAATSGGGAQLVAAAERRFASAGPAIGTLGDHSIAAWLVDTDGTRWDYAGCASDPASPQLQQHQTLVPPGLIYEVRGKAPSTVD